MAQYISQIKPLGSTAVYDLKAVYAASASFATTAEYAGTAAYAITAGNASWANTANYTVTAAYAITAGNASWANTANYSKTAAYAITAGNAKWAITANYAMTANFARTALTANYAMTANFARTALTASYSVTAAMADQALSLKTAGRVASADIYMGDNTYKSKITTMLASSTMTTSKPPTGDGYILNFGWDSTAGWGAQMAISHVTANHVVIRGAAGVSSSSKWGDWHYLLDSMNYTDYTVSKTGTGATGSWSISVTTASYAVTASFATTALYAKTAAYAITAGNAVLAGTATFAKSATSASYAGTATFAFYAGTATMALYSVTANYAVTASYAANALYAGTASYAITAGNALSALNATNADYAGTATFAIDAVHASSAAYANYSGNGVEYIVGTGTTAGDWLGTTVDAALTTGKVIAYKIGIAGASTTNLTLTLSGGTSVKYKVILNASSNLTTHFAVGTVIILTFDGTNWKTFDYNTNSDTKVTQTLKGDTDNTNRPLLLAYSANTVTTANVTDVSYRNNAIYANPSTGIITAVGFSGMASNAMTANYAVTAEYALNAAAANHADTADSATNADYAGTATFAITADSATLAGTATYAINAGAATTALYAMTAAFAITAGRAQWANTANYSRTAAYAITAGYSRTAAYAITAGRAQWANTANYAMTANFARTALTASYAITAALALLTDSANYAGTATFALYAGTATMALYSNTATWAVTAAAAVNATYAGTANYAITAGNAINAVNAINSDYAITATWAIGTSYATSAAYAAYASNGIEYIVGTGTTAGEWLATTSDATLETGKIIAYKIGIAGASTTKLSLTLSGGTTTQHTVILNASTNLTTHYPVGSVVFLTFDGTNWKTSDYYISNTDTKVRQSLTSTDVNRPILLAYSGTTVTTANIDNTSYRNNSIYANPSTGIISATGFNGMASNAMTANYAVTAGNAQWAMTASYAMTANFARTALTASYSITASQAITAAYAVTAAYAITAGNALWAMTANYAVTAAHAIGAAITTTTYAAARYIDANGTFANSTVTISDEGRITTPIGLTITSTTQDSHILFSRNGYNYINVPTGTSACLAIGTAASSAGSWVQFNAATFRPEADKTISLGTSAYTWKGIYSGNIQVGGTKNSDDGKTIVSSSTLYLATSTRSSIIFKTIGTNRARFDIDGHFRPETTNTYTLGLGGSTSAARWKALYIGTADSYGDNTNPIYWNNGVPTAITYTANRLYYSESATAFTATLHYSSATAIAVNTTEAPTETFYVNGNSQLKGTVWINNTTDIVRGTTGTGALVIGEKGTKNISIDTDEIMARNGAATATLFTQYEGGGFQIGNTAAYVNPMRVYASPAYFTGYYDFVTTNGFNYSGMTAATVNAEEKPLWYDFYQSSTSTHGRPIYSPKLRFNTTGTRLIIEGQTNTGWSGIDNPTGSLRIHAGSTSGAGVLYLDAGIAPTVASGAPGSTILFRQGTTTKAEINPFGSLIVNSTDANIGRTDQDATTSQYVFYVNGRSKFEQAIVPMSNIQFHNKNCGVWFKDSTAATYAGVIDNGANLWIGAQQSQAIHHKGQIDISTGHNGTTANDFALLCYPILDNAATGHATSVYSYYITHTPAMTANRLIYSVSNHGRSAYAPLLETNGNWLHINNSQDVSGSTDNSGNAPFAVGAFTGIHIEMDNNEILCKNGTTSNQWLYLTDGSGGVNVWGTAGLQVPQGNVKIGRRPGWNNPGATPASATGTGIWLFANGQMHTAMTANCGGYWGFHFNGASATSASIAEYESGTVRVLNNFAVNTATKSHTANGLTAATAYGLAVNGSGFFNGNVVSNEYMYIYANVTGAAAQNRFVIHNRGVGATFLTIGNGTTTTAGYSALYLGNTIGTGVDKNSYGRICLRGHAASTSGNVWINGALGTLGSTVRAYASVGYMKGTQIWGAVWNDYAEYRETKEEIEPGRCVVETGKGDLVLSSERLQAGAEIVSDTFGFAIGQTKKSNTPIATTGRVLAYLLEDRETARQNIGGPVGSGPNGTVSIMTDEEASKYPWKIIGTISEIPDYEQWQVGDVDNEFKDPEASEEDLKPKYVEVNGRIWIRVR